MAANIKIKKMTSIDDNAIERSKKLNIDANIKKPLTKETKRVAFGDVSNKNRLEKNEIGKDILKQDAKNLDKSKKIASSTLEVTNENNAINKLKNLKDIKPRVDTHWNAKLPKRAAATKAKVTMAAVAASKKIGATMVRMKSPVKKPIATIPPVVQETKLTDPLKVEKVRNQKELPLVIAKENKNQETQIEDIDLEDNCFLVPEYAQDIYNYLLSLEKKFTINPNYLDKQTEISSRMRSVLIDWINEVSFQFRLLNETYHLCVEIIDHYLQNGPNVKKQKLQLVGTAALFIASKYEELYPTEVSDLAYITDDAYTVEEILLMEQQILKVLSFVLYYPLSINFLRRFSKAANADNIIHQAAKYFLELSTIYHTFTHQPASQIASASLLLSLILFDNSVKDSSAANCFDVIMERLWTPTLKYYSSYDVKDLKQTVIKLAEVASNAPTTKFKAVYIKYQSDKFDSVSMKPQLNSEKLRKLSSTD